MGKNADMSKSEIERFTADLKTNEPLRAATEKALADAAPGTRLDTMVSFAAGQGYAFAAPEVREHVQAEPAATGRALSDAELQGIAGGVDFSVLPPELNSWRLYAGPGPGPSSAAASAWAALAQELASG